MIHGTNGETVKVYYESQRGKGEYNIAFEGLLENVKKRYRETGSETMKAEYESFMRINHCKDCDGKRLRKEALAVTVGEKNIAELTEYSIRKLNNFMNDL